MILQGLRGTPGVEKGKVMSAPMGGFELQVPISIRPMSF